jgi:hypothetical protein
MRFIMNTPERRLTVPGRALFLRIRIAPDALMLQPQNRTAPAARDNVFGRSPVVPSQVRPTQEGWARR